MKVAGIGVHRLRIERLRGLPRSDPLTCSAGPSNRKQPLFVVLSCLSQGRMLCWLSQGSAAIDNVDSHLSGVRSRHPRPGR
jgi:hypothetical protein